MVENIMALGILRATQQVFWEALYCNNDIACTPSEQLAYYTHVASYPGPRRKGLVRIACACAGFSGRVETHALAQDIKVYVISVLI